MKKDMDILKIGMRRENMSSLDDNREPLDFTGEGRTQLPYQCEFCTILLIPHSDPNRLTTGQLWICPTCGTVKDDSLEDEPIMGARASGTVMDDISPSTDLANSIQFINEEKGLMDKRQNKIDQLLQEEIYNDPDFRKKGIVKGSIKVSEEVSK